MKRTARSFGPRESAALRMAAVGLCFGVAALGAGRAGAETPPFDLLIRGGHVIDPKNGIDAVADVAITDGRIARVAADLPASGARRVVEASGLYVVPGLVDIHAHVFAGTEADAYLSDGPSAVAPDGFTLRSGVTTVVDAGGAGWRNFRKLKDQIVDRSKTRVLALLNIVGSGMKGGPAEQNLGDMDPALTAARIAEFPDVLVGVKVAHYAGPEWDPVDRAVDAGRRANVPVMVDFGEHTPELSLEALLLHHLRPGDMFTHTYAAIRGRTAIVDTRGRVRPYVLEARQRGVLFDVGHGAASFLWEQAEPAVQQGLAPDSISTDLHALSMNAGMKDQLNVMSKFLSLGLSLQDVVQRATWNPARQIRRYDLGHMSPGAVADVAVLRVRDGAFGFVDAVGARRAGAKKLECELTLRAGHVAWDLNGIAPVEKEGKVRVYVGTYTDGASKGIYTLDLDLASGALTPAGVPTAAANPSFLALHPSGRFLYAVNEVGDFGGAKTGAVSAFAVDPTTGGLTLLNQQASGGDGPCHLSLDAEGRHVLVANYDGGSVAVLPIGADGRLGAATSIVKHRGSGPNKERQEAPHAHSIDLDAAGRFALVSDLGTDRVLVYRFDPARGTLTPNAPAAARLAPGSGPRHFTLHPDGRHGYAIDELKSTVTAFTYDGTNGTLEEIQTVPTLPAGFTGANDTAEVAVSPDGKFLYGSNRGHDSLAIFAIDAETGRLTLVGHQPTLGKTPRHFAIDPTGSYLLVANQDSGSIVVFRIDRASGRLTAVGSPASVPKPVCLKMVEVTR